MKKVERKKYKVKTGIVLICTVIYLTDRYTPWSIKKGATFIFSITLANIDGFS